MNKTPKGVLALAAALLLSACSPNTPSSSSSPVNTPESTPGSGSSSPVHSEGLYTKLTRAIANLSNFTASGTLEYGAYDLSGGSTLDSATYRTQIDVLEDAYYYSENDLASNEVIMEERFLKNEDGKLAREVLNPMTNEVEELISTENYDVVMANPFLELKVADFEAIKGQLQWYEINNGDLVDEAVYFLTGYDTSALDVAQFAIHFDGDNFDQMRILMEYYDDYSEPTYAEQYLFTLQLGAFGEASAKEVTPYPETEGNKKLQAALTKLAEAKSLTINATTKTIDGKTTYSDYDYLLDFESYTFVDPVPFTKNVYDENGEVVSSYECFSVYKQVGEDIDLSDDNTTNDGKLMLFDLNAETHEVVKTADFNEYFGTSSAYSFYSLVPLFPLLCGAGYKDLGSGKFAPYIATYEYASSALFPFGATYSFSSAKNNMTVYMEGDDIDRVELTYSAYAEESYDTIALVDAISYSGLDATVLPDYIANLGA